MLLLPGSETRQFVFDLTGVLYDLKSSPVRGKQMAVTSMGKAVIDQYNNPPIYLRANHPTGGLQHSVETRILISIGKPTDLLMIKIIFDQISLQAHLWYPHNTDQPFSHEIDPFAKDTTHDSEPYLCFLITGGKLG